MNTNMIPLTDNRGEPLLPLDKIAEPEPGSVVLTDGIHGTAWQRFFSDGLWHPTRGGGSKAWEKLLQRRNVVMVYEAPVRVEKSPEARSA